MYCNSIRMKTRSLRKKGNKIRITKHFYILKFNIYNYMIAKIVSN